VEAELPPRTEIVHRVVLSPPERELYEGIRTTAAAALGAAAGELQGNVRFQVLAALTRLRQASCHPRLVDATSTAPSAKEKALLRLVADLRDEGHRALIFSQFVRHLELARAALRDAGWRCLQLDGSTPAKERRRLVEEFQDGVGDVFLISLKAGGTGLNLTGATYVIHLDPWWNPAVEDQASDRTHRIGQTRPVTVYRLVAGDTVEEKILEMQADKRELVEALISGADRSAPMSVEELVQLLAEAPPEQRDHPAEDAGSASSNTS
jgi:SNF2 family DNA or RNA helicase